MEKKTVFQNISVDMEPPPEGELHFVLAYLEGSENIIPLQQIALYDAYLKKWSCETKLLKVSSWLKKATAITISEEEAAQLETLNVIQERLKSEIDWTTPIDDVIHVPDELDPLINKIGFHVKLHTISKLISEEEMVCRIAFASQKFFSQFQPASPIVDGWVDVKENGLPKDSEDYQVWEKGAICPTIAHYLDKTYFVDNYDDENYMEEGWYYSFKYPFDDNIQHDDPLDVTHYCPLPTPPTSKG